MGGTPRRTCTAVVGLVTIGFVTLSISPASVATDNSDEYSIEKIFYGNGWVTDPTSGLPRYIALLNLTESYQRRFSGNGTFDAFSQIFVEFSIPANDSGPVDGPALKLLFSYYVDMRCIGLDNETCPLGSNDTSIVHDVFELEIRRILEYRDADGSGAYEPGDPIVNVISLSQPQLPHIRAWPFDRNGSGMDLPYDWSATTNGSQVSEGRCSRAIRFSTSSPISGSRPETEFPRT